jgi:hypothetical protein
MREHFLVDHGKLPNKIITGALLRFTLDFHGNMPAILVLV